MIKINNWFINTKLYVNKKKTNHLIYITFNDDQLYICIGNNVLYQV